MDAGAALASVLARSAREAPEGQGTPRREIKYALPAADLGKLTSILRTNFREVRHGESRSTVRSIYFDDEIFGAYHDSLEGTGERHKVRLRWYNDDEQALFFEIKTRAFDLVSKRRTPVDSSVPLSALSYRDLLRALRALLEAPGRELLERYARPVLLAEYARDYYEGDDVRVTVDTDLRWFDQLGALRPRRRFGIRLARFVVLEVKVPPTLPSPVGELLRPLRLSPTRSSKYAIGCQQLGLF